MKLNNIEKAVSRGIHRRTMCGRFRWVFIYFKKEYYSDELDKDSAIMDLSLQLNNEQRE